MYSAAPAFSYSSSPPSSPGPSIDSSSPASSPAPDIYIQDDENIPPLSLTHPFAASAGANWRPPQYEKKRSNPEITPPAMVKRSRYTYDLPVSPWQSSPTNSTFSVSPSSVMVPTRRQVEKKIWGDAVAKAFDEGHGAIALDDYNLTFFPDSFINDLEKFYVPAETCEFINSTQRPVMSPPNRLLTRVATTPASQVEHAPQLWQRSRSAAAVSFGLPREKVQLFLSSNHISALPSALFSLQNLTVLSLRNNRITYIPPEIIGLKNLEDLNIAQNKIRYLPAEMLQMSLKFLHLHPNSFLDPPNAADHRSLRSSTLSRSNISQRRLVSATKRFDLPSFVEHLLRALLSPSPTSEQTVLETHYNLPIAESFADLAIRPCQGKVHLTRDLPPYLRKLLHACLPGSVYVEEEDSEAEDTRETSSDTCEVTGVGLCPSPKHQQLGTPRLFVRHAEERFTWEMMIAGTPVSGRVPVRWRGCQWGCLDFLDPPREAKQLALEVPNIETSDHDIDIDDGEDLESVVQPMHLNGPQTLGGLSDFDD